MLYPSDESPAGQELRLRQEFFFASASLQDLLRRHSTQHGSFSSLPDHAAIQLNDTHPAIAIAEMMRLLVDVHGMPWEEAWRITTGTFNYTNHTLLPEALETWSVPLLERLLPRHMQIIYLINSLHLDELRAEGHKDDRLLSSVSLIEEDHGRRVRMGNLAFLGVAPRERRVGAAHRAHAQDGVPRLRVALSGPHRQQDQRHHVPALALPGESGAHPPHRRRRRRRRAGRRRQARCASSRSRTMPHSASASPPRRRTNKVALARLVRERIGVAVDPDALFDVQIKRIHEYKRQLLNILETIALYDAMRAQPTLDWVPRVKIFAGKAAASYQQAKLVIKLANDVARIVNDDPAMRGLLKVVFLPNYNVSLAEAIIPAADLSEQISTAGMEASGTGNMKLALNGALTHRHARRRQHRDPRSRRRREHLHLRARPPAEVAERRANGIDAADAIAASPALVGGAGRARDRACSRPTTASATADSSTRCAITTISWSAPTSIVSLRAAPAGRALARPGRMVAHVDHATLRGVGWFSSDRAIAEYASEIWQADAGRDS